MILSLLLLHFWRVFLHHHQLIFFHWSLNDNTSPRVFKTLLSILADFNNAIVCMVSILLLISISFRLLSKPLGTVTNTPTIIRITVTFTSQLSVKIPEFLNILTLIFPLWSAETVKFTSWLLCFLLIKTRSGLPSAIGYSVCISISQRIFMSLIFLLVNIKFGNMAQF